MEQIGLMEVEVKTRLLAAWDEIHESAALEPIALFTPELGNVEMSL
jgi:hypothetical protein